MKKIMVSTIVSSLLFTGMVMANAEKKELTTQEVNKKATEVATQQVKDNRAKLIQEALGSLALSAKALKSLDENKKDEAKKNIELALGKLEAILASKKVPKLLPIENRIVVKNFIGTSKDVALAIESVKALLNKGKVQEAGALLISLQSELDVTTVSLPLATYPDALKLASKYIFDNKINEAKDTLHMALSSFAEIETIIPIPLINSVELVRIASEKAKENRELAVKYLLSAEDELNKAEKLGYVSKSATTYQELNTLIEGVKKEVKGPNKAEKLFIELSNKLKEFKRKIFSEDSNKTE